MRFLHIHVVEGESSRTLVEKFKEHLKAPHILPITGHTTTMDNFSIVGREYQTLTRTIKESIYTKVNGPSLTKNIGKYHQPYIWDEVLLHTQELKITYTYDLVAIPSTTLWHNTNHYDSATMNFPSATP